MQTRTHHPRQARALRAVFGLGLTVASVAGCVAEVQAPPPPRPEYRPEASYRPPPPPSYAPGPRPGAQYPGGAGPGGYPGGPGTGGRSQLTLFTGPGFRGAAANVDRAVPDLRASGFDNHVSSIAVTGRWQLCTRPGFAGRCVVVAGSVPNLQQLGLDNQISSVRRAP